MSADHKEPRRPVSLRERILSVPTLVSFGAAGLFVFLLTTRFDIDWTATRNNIGEINPWLYVVAIISYYISFGFRGLRWKILAENASAGEENIPSSAKFAQLIIIGWFVNAIAGLRLGDAYRSFALADESRGSFPWSLGTVLAERVLDMAIIMGLIVVSSIFLSATSDSSILRYILITTPILAVLLVGFTIAMGLLRDRTTRILPGRFREVYERFHQGTLGSFKRLPLLMSLGLLGWLMEIARVYFVVQALGLDVDPALIAIVALGHAILSTVPTPGGIGVVEPGITGLLLLSLDHPAALSVTVVDRSITYLSVVVVGLVAFLARQAEQAQRKRRASREAAVPRERGRPLDA